MAEVFAKEVSTELHLETIDDSQDALVSTNQGVVMTGIGDDKISVGKGGDVSSFVDGLL